MTASRLMDIYFSSVGRNSVLLLNIPPDKDGLISDADIRSLRAWRLRMDSTFSVNLAVGATVSGDRGVNPGAMLDGKPHTYWTTRGDTVATMELALKGEKTFDVLLLGEAIWVGQRVERFAFDVKENGEWKEVVSGTTIGYKRLLRFPPVTTHTIRLRILSSRMNPTIAQFGLYKLAE